MLDDVDLLTFMKMLQMCFRSASVTTQPVRYWETCAPCCPSLWEGLVLLHQQPVSCTGALLKTEMMENGTFCAIGHTSLTNPI